MKKRFVRVGITMGDPSGIGPFIAAMAIRELSGQADFTLIGDSWVFERAVSLQAMAPGPKRFECKFINLNNVCRDNFSFGRVDPEYGRASLEYLDKAYQLIKESKIDCLVTCPISKESINLAGSRYPGHTELLADLTGTSSFAMMLVNKQLKLGLVTRHIPVKDISSELSQENIRSTILLTAASLKNEFLIKSPRLVVCGLNPHASDNGLIGREENSIIKPVLSCLKEDGLVIDGPLSADVAIYKTLQKKYDCAVAMFHDQALIPLKLLSPDTGVNLTLGLPFVRTSCLHGTAFDIVEKPETINPSSLIEAVKLAVKCTSNQKKD